VKNTPTSDMVSSRKIEKLVSRHTKRSTVVLVI
jgi:ABC-type phosphate transport system ATPase subunit